MKYSDLIEFDPIESVIQLREADAETSARQLVESYVISDRMAEQLTGLIFEQLQFDKPADNKGLLVVGNYGTGKSHLMAVVSAIAEHDGLGSSATNAQVQEKAAAIAGKFKVVRAEIGATKMSLRDIICGTLESHLSELGVEFAFPSAEEVTNNKDALVDLMGAFEEKHPGQGLLLVLDELLDFLRTRQDQALILDLNFLREIGEVCKTTRFRFLSGVQESLFDNARFQFVAETLRRVKDRFEQVRIAREDVAYVVSRRLLKKTPEQEGRIRNHLTEFAPLYSSMQSRMDKFVELFPVHPAYIDTFERVYVAEKREVLKTLSAAIREIIDDEVPTDAPGVIAYDDYWQNLKDNPSFRSETDIREVISKSKVVEDRIEQAYTHPTYKPVALRIVHALSVHRLTTEDIFRPIGATAEELRDDLCLVLPTPEKDADFLKTLVEKALQEILKTVSGQFISYNAENGQYYLDLKKDVDFDSLIAQRAEALDAGQLDRYYFDALTQVMERADQSTHVSGYRIWEHEVDWRERKAERSGYLFFGAPNERSTAQPPRDFYLYFLQPHDAPYFKDEKKPDEVFFELKQRDEAFGEALKLYAGAREQAATASGDNKRIYDDKATTHLRALTKWLRENITTAFQVTYQGTSKPLAEVIQGKVQGGVSQASVRDLINIAGSVCLGPQFENKSPDYPVFSVLVTRQNREQSAGEALRWISGGVKSKPGTAVLDALELLDGEQLRPAQSRYAKHVLEQLGEKKDGQVLNRAELVQPEDGVEYWTRFRLEPEFLAVVLAALVHSGDLVLSIPGKKLGADAVDQFGAFPVGDLAGFKHVERPKGLPLGPLRELCELLGLPQGLIVDPAKRDQAVQQLQIEVADRVKKLVVADASLREGLMFWGQPLLSEQEVAEWRKRLASAKEFLESLQAFNTVGKLNNFPHDKEAVRAQQEGLALVREVDELGKLVAQVGPEASYLSTAEAILPTGHPWLDKVKEAKAGLLPKARSPKHRADSGFHRDLVQTLQKLKTEYQDAYLELHKRAHLDAKSDEKKANLGKDPRLKQLQKLDTVEMMPHQQLKSFQDRLFGLKTCYSLSRKDLETSASCPHVPFKPAEEPAGKLAAAEVLITLDDELDGLVAEWTKVILENLTDPTVEKNIELLVDPKGKEAVEQFLESKALPDPVPPAFVQALQEALEGLEKVAVADADLHAALIKGGVPCTIEDLKGRFDGYLAQITKGKDASRVRIVIE